MSFVIASRSVWLAPVVGVILLMVPHAQAEWWKRAPVDFEDCAERAEQSATKAEKTAALADCHAKFAGRRKPGGGYTYYDFLQDRSFDIAGPNPTSEEQRRMDMSYTAYLANQRRIGMTAPAPAKPQDALPAQAQAQARVQDVTLRTEAERVPLPIERPKQLLPTPDPRSRTKGCAKDAFSCEWPRLSEGLNELKRLFNPAPAKAKKG